MNSIFLSQKVFAAARVTDSASGQKSNKQKFNDVLRDDPNAIDITYKKKASSMYKNSLKNLPKNPKSHDEFHESLLKHDELNKCYLKRVVGKGEKLKGKTVGFIFGNPEMLKYAKKI